MIVVCRYSLWLVLGVALLTSCSFFDSLEAQSEANDIIGCHTRGELSLDELTVLLTGTWEGEKAIWFNRVEGEWQQSSLKGSSYIFEEDGTYTWVHERDLISSGEQWEVYENDRGELGVRGDNFDITPIYLCEGRFVIHGTPVDRSDSFFVKVD